MVSLVVAPPTINCPGDAIVTCFSEIAIGVAVANTSCGIASAITTSGPTLVSGVPECNGAVYAIVYTVTDDCGQTADCTQNFTLNLAAPTISCPGMGIVPCVDDIVPGVPVASVACSLGSVITNAPPTLFSGVAGCDGSVYEVTFTVTDDCGATATCMQFFELDSPPPTIVCPPDRTVACLSDIAPEAAVTTSSCGFGNMVTTGPPVLVSGTPQCTGAVYSVEYVVTDDCGQTAMCLQFFTLNVTPPIIDCEPDLTIQCISDLVAGTPTATVSCGLTSVVSSSGNLLSGTPNCDGAVYAITFVVTDQCGQTGSCAQTFTLDVPPPMITCEPDVTVDCFSEVVPGNPDIFVACMFGSDLETVGPTLLSGTPECDGAVYEIIYTITDDCGESATCAQIFTLDVPTLTIECQPDMTVGCFEDVVEMAPTITNGCNFNIVVTTVGPTLISGTDNCFGAVYTIDYAVSDNCGQSASCTQTFTLDVAPPEIICPADMTVDCQADVVVGTPTNVVACNFGFVESFSGPTLISGVDGCNGAVYEVVYFLEDDCGGATSCSQTITLLVPPPTIVCPPDETINCLADLTFGIPTTGTSCSVGSSVATVGPTLASGVAECNGAVYEVEYIVTDDCGQVTTCIQSFTLAVPPPVIDCPFDEIVSCFGDINEGIATATASCGHGVLITTVGPKRNHSVGLGIRFQQLVLIW